MLMTELNGQTLTKWNIDRRIAAFLIDYVAICCMVVGICFLFGFPDDSNPSKIRTIFSFGMLVGIFLYLVKDSIKGMSLGKWAMGIMVRNKSDFHSTPSFIRLIIRNLFVLIWPVEFIVMVANKSKRRLGDLAAGTVVLNNPGKAQRPTRVLVPVAVYIIIIAFAFLCGMNAMKKTDAYIFAIHAIETNREIIRETGGITGYGIPWFADISYTDTHGEAQFHIRVHGKTKNLGVNVYLKKEPDKQWELKEIEK
jgi:uncharacterized RDD family membrane protein YckC